MSKPKERVELEKFVESEQTRMEKERKDFLKKKGYKEFFTAPVGTTTLVLLPVIPRAVKSAQYETRYAFRIEVGGVEFDWTVNPRSPVYRDLIAHLRGAPAEFDLVRTGLKQQTRYDLVWK